MRSLVALSIHYCLADTRSRNDIDTGAQRFDTFDTQCDTMELQYLLNLFDTVDSC